MRATYRYVGKLPEGVPCGQAREPYTQQKPVSEAARARPQKVLPPPMTRTERRVSFIACRIAAGMMSPYLPRGHSYTRSGMHGRADACARHGNMAARRAAAAEGASNLICHAATGRRDCLSRGLASAGICALSRSEDRQRCRPQSQRAAVRRAVSTVGGVQNIESARDARPWATMLDAQSRARAHVDAIEHGPACAA
jgi:hypothetical protein